MMSRAGATLALSLVLVLPGSAIGRTIEQVLVVIDREPYTLSDLRHFAETRIGREFPAGELDPIAPSDREVLELFITDKLLADEIKRAGIRVTEQDVDQYIGQIRERNKLTEEDLNAALAREGVSMEKYRDSIRAEIEKAEIINRQVRKRVNITSEDIERYYQIHQRKFRTDERVRLSHILFAFPRGASAEREKEIFEHAREVRRRALSGADFAALARAHSQGAGAADGGDIGWMKRGTLLREIEEEAFQKLSVGDVSEPIKTSLGYHLIRLDEKDPGRQLGLSEVQSRIREELYATALEERYQKWLKTDLRKNHRVDVKIPGVVFRPEDSKEGTVGTLMASAPRRSRREARTFLSYLNPFSYILTETPVEGVEADGAPSDRNVVSLFGIPLFTTEAADDVPAGDPLATLESSKPAPTQQKE